MPDGEPAGPRRGLDVRTWVAVTALYLAAVISATWPYALTFASRLPAAGDPPQHLWIMRWYKACLQEGRSPLVCPELQYPVGAPLGNFSPLHVQSVLYLGVSSLISNDVLCFNLIWLVGYVTTGLGTFLLAWHLLRSQGAASLAGLLAMLASPVMLHAHAHLELHFLGAFPLFLWAWLRFLDEPGRRRLLQAAGLYLLLVACAAYFAVMAAIPAIFAAAWAMLRGGHRGLVPWLRGRLGWLAGFVAIVGPSVALLLAGQLWAVAHGQSMARSRVEFEDHGSPLWSYATPLFLHRLSRALPSDPYAAAGYVGIRGGLLVDNCSYLGVVTLLLLGYAAVRRAAIPRRAFWWATLALLVVLSLGAGAKVGSGHVSLPAMWLWRGLPAFRMLRSPARFNLFAAVVAAILAGAGLRDLLARLRWRSARAAVVGALSVMAVLDLGLTPYLTWEVAPLPACYTYIRGQDPRAAVLELPVQSSCFDLTELDRTYWQSLHRLRTSAGYSGIRNAEFDRRVFWHGPVPTWRADLLAQPEVETFGLAAGVSFRDHLWLFLNVYQFDYVILHHGPARTGLDPALVERLKAALRDATVFEDKAATVYARRLLPAPTRPAWLCLDGWTSSMGRPGPARHGARKVATLAVYQPDENRPLALELDAAASGPRRTVRLVADGAERARWAVGYGAPTHLQSPPFRLPAGVQVVRLESDGEARPRSSREAVDEARSPYSLRVQALQLTDAEAMAEGTGPARR